MTRVISILKQALYKPIGIYHSYISGLKRKKTLSKKPKIYLLNVPTHGNLGDHLISVAEQKFLKDKCPDYEVICITSSELYYSIPFALLSVQPKDILCITGGGFLGSMYDEERRFIKITKKFKQNKVIIFPQTIFYEVGTNGRKALNTAKEAYSNHQNLFVMAREKATYDLLKTELMNGKEDKIALTPDIALYLHEERKMPRKYVLWCLRNDGEVNSNNHYLIKKAKSYILKYDIPQKETDTYIPHFIPLENEKKEVENKINEFAKSRMVITDRLHGMIYAVITGTPVVALNNHNGKVEQVYRSWLSDNPYVKFVSDIKDIEPAIHLLMNVKNMVYDNSKIVSRLTPIIEAIYA